MKKRVLSIVAVFMCLGIVYMTAKKGVFLQQTDRIEVLGRGRHDYPVLIDSRAGDMQTTVALQDISAIYDEEIRQIPLELLLDVQQYVVQKDFEGALAAYGDDSLCMDIDSFAELCPEYNKLYAEYWNREVSDNGEIAADFIYKVELDGVGGEEFLVFYQPHTAGIVEVSYVRESVDGYQIEYHYSHGGSNREFVLFCNEEESGNIYYELMVNDVNMGESSSLRLTRYEAKQDINTGKYYLQREIRSISELKVGIQPYIIYLDYKNPYAFDAKTYIEENLWVLYDCAEYSQYWWGDEEDVTSQYSDYWDEELEEVVENKYHTHGIVRADYDNDGEMEWFDRTGKFQNKLIEVNDLGQYTVEIIRPGSVLGGYDAKRMWFVKFQDKIITFQLVNHRNQEWIEAFLLEGDASIPLLICQIEYTYEIGLGGTYEWWYNVPLSEDVEMLAAEDKTWFADNCEQKMLDLRWENKIESFEGEIAFGAGLYELLQKDIYHLMDGEEPQAVSAYRIDTTADTELFLSKLGEEDEWLSMMCRWAYKLDNADETEEYLVYEDNGGTGGVCYLSLFEITEKGIKCKTLIDFGSSRGYDGLLWYKNQLIFVCETISYYEGQTQGYSITVFEENGEYANYNIQYKAEIEEYQCIPIYEQEDAAVCAWVRENAQNLIGRIEQNEISLFDYEEQDLTIEEKRIVRNLMRKNFIGESKCAITDVNNDGLEEYFILSKYEQSENTYVDWEIYGYKDEMLRQLTISPITYSSTEGLYTIMLDFAEFDGETCMLTVEQIYNSHDYLVRARVIKDGEIEQKGVWLFRAALQEEIFPVEN